tara:strand:+ start:77 stop:352 length:276 start_codon:yes stop_codon:yes gene_type:complete
MLDTLRWELDKALLVCMDGKDIPLEQRWELELQDIDRWYAEMTLLAESYGRTLTHILTYFEEIPTVFWLDDITAELNALDVEDPEKIHLNW